uniref:Ig-like domain-containing protein n=1 Tax=Strix occidentalis caurina TaxID=311401 RepID=A0A8D0EW78_STROC
PPSPPAPLQMRFPVSPRGLLSYLVTLHILRLGSDGFRVVGPGYPLRATVGQDVVLPCHLSPPKDAQSLEILWIRHQFSEIVHHYRNGEDQYGDQLRAYWGRTELVRAGLPNGSLDLRILGLRPSDDGQYVCTVQNADSYAEASVDLEVAGVWPVWGFQGTVRVSVGLCVPARPLSHPPTQQLRAKGQVVGST